MISAPWQVRSLTDADRDALRSLLSSVRPVGPQLERGEDPFAHPRLSGEPHHVGAFVQGRMVAVAGINLQRRHVAGRAQPTAYLFDVRVLPELRRTLVLTSVLRRLFGLLSGSEWVYATVLENNPYMEQLARGTSWLGQGRCLGRTTHCAWPVFLDACRRLPRVTQTDADEASRAYFAMAPGIDMSPADELRFRGGGAYFVHKQHGRVTAVGRLVSESPAREVRQDLSTALAARPLQWIARARGYPPLTNCHGAARLAYLSCFATDSGIPCSEFAAAAASAARVAPYVCFGVDASVPVPFHPLSVSFTSATFGYGSVPGPLTLRAHELTWM